MRALLYFLNENRRIELIELSIVLGLDADLVREFEEFIAEAIDLLRNFNDLIIESIVAFHGDFVELLGLLDLLRG